MINFKLNWNRITTHDLLLIDQIIDRAAVIYEEAKETKLTYSERKELKTVVAAVHLNEGGLDLKGLVSADNFTLCHDVFGIENNLNRETGKLDNCFLPRSSLA